MSSEFMLQHLYACSAFLHLSTASQFDMQRVWVQLLNDVSVLFWCVLFTAALLLYDDNHHLVIMLRIAHIAQIVLWIFVLCVCVCENDDFNFNEFVFVIHFFYRSVHFAYLMAVVVCREGRSHTWLCYCIQQHFNNIYTNESLHSVCKWISCFTLLLHIYPFIFATNN